MNFAVPLILASGFFSSASSGERDAKVAALRELPLEVRVVELSQAFLGTPYVLSPLGEGDAGVKDRDPLIRYDAVDCVTLVEEVMAMSLAPDTGSRLETLNRIRYGGADPPAWETRNHIMEAQWLPKNIERGLLRDVTRAYAGKHVVVASKVLTAQTWAEKNGIELALPLEARPMGTFTLDLVPASVALSVLSAAPSGLIVVVVRADRPKAVTRVSHVGFLIQTPKGPVLRHASRSYKQVADEPLGHYLKRNLDFGKWTIEGLALFEVSQPP